LGGKDKSMKLNHINLVVSNVAEACSLFTTYFNFTCTEIKGDHIIAVLNGDDDFTLVIMSDKSGNVSYPDAFHIGFMMDDTDSVLKTYEKLKNGGIAVGKDQEK
jgi:catechol 2,3-dioxygenase-like lactoylglutathione lyase family enzyme